MSWNIKNFLCFDEEFFGFGKQTVIGSNIVANLNEYCLFGEQKSKQAILAQGASLIPQLTAKMFLILDFSGPLWFG